MMDETIDELLMRHKSRESNLSKIARHQLEKSRDVTRKMKGNTYCLLNTFILKNLDRSRPQSREKSQFDLFKSNPQEYEEETRIVIEPENIDESKKIASNKDGYYWIGKDYANAYKGDCKDIHEYEKGKKITRNLITKNEI